MAAQFREALTRLTILRRKQVEARTGLSRSTHLRANQIGNLPYSGFHRSKGRRLHPSQSQTQLAEGAAMTRADFLRQLTATLPGVTAATQRQRIMAALRTGPLSTVEAIRFLDIIRPSARIAELRNDGHRIITTWRADATETGEPHRVALYVLTTGSSDVDRRA